MATETVPHESPLEAIDRASAKTDDFGRILLRIPQALASLKFTVALFAMAIFLVLAGTMAQHRKDIWQVVEEYFRAPVWPYLGFARIEFQDFLPPSFFPSKPQVSGWFLFPGGRLIGGLMALNLLAAHGLRFKPQASGTRLWAGLWVIAAGLVVTMLVVASGSNKAGVHESIWGDWTALWVLMKIGLGATFLASIYGFGWMIMRGKYEWWLLGLAAHVPAILGGLFFYTLLGGQSAELDPASMRILWQLIKGTIAGLVLLGGCIMVFKKRAGVVLLHAGIGLMMISELQVSMTAVEGQMWIQEGEAVNFVRDIRKLELAVIDTTDRANIKATVIPESILIAGGKISHEELPVDFEIVKFLRNSDMRRVQPNDKNLATQGAGRQLFATEVRVGTGTDTAGEIDKSSAYVKLTSKDGKTDYGTYLVSIWFDNPTYLSFLRNPLRFTGEMPQMIEVDGKSYEVALRFKRTYKPYTMLLDDIRKEDYVGTSKPRDYSSYVRLKDPGRKVDREVRIWMNNPLRFAGETFYQSNWLRDPWTGGESTSLAVVTNTGWMIPYVSCMIVATGLLTHFLVVLVRFLNRREQEQRLARQSTGMPGQSKIAGAMSPQEKMARQLVKGQKAKIRKVDRKPQPAIGSRTLAGEMSLLGWLVPLVVVVICAAWVASKARPPRPAADNINLYEFGKIPIVYQGRQKPIDTMARNALRVISDKQTFKGRMTEAELDKNWEKISRAVAAKWEKLSAADLEAVDHDIDELIELIETQTGDDRRQVEAFVESNTTVRRPAIRWLLDVIALPEAAEKHKIFRIENLEVQETLGLPRRKGFRYSVEEFREKILELDAQIDLARQVSKESPEKLSVYQRKILELSKRIQTFMLLSETLRRPALPSLPDARDFQDPAKRPAVAEAYQTFNRALTSSRDRQQFLLTQFTPPRIVPVHKKMRHDEQIPAAILADRDEWETYATAWTNDVVRARIFGKDANPATLALQEIFVAYATDDAAAFNDNVKKYQSALSADPPTKLDATRTSFEVFFNHFEPFFYSIWLYFLAFVLACLAWLGWTRPLNNASSWLILLTLGLHTFALVSRIYISGRPPVTNLYSSAVFIGWGGVILGLVVEAIYRIGVGNIFSAVAGFATLWIAHLLAGDGDTFTVLQAVLDTQFWLATHVTSITMGYATTFMAGLMGLLYVLRGFATPSLSQKIGRDLSRMIYGTLCFAIFFSFVGTVLGGLWADDSWGRFWGWDPKENGALIIVLWNALVLHARWGGMVKERGLAVLAIGGNIVTAWSWFGVNELGVGLHSYGFTDGVLMALLAWVMGNFAVVLIGCLPKTLWWSFRERQAAVDES